MAYTETAPHKTVHFLYVVYFALLVPIYIELLSELECILT